MARPLALFDLDNTLVDRLAAFERWAAEFAARRGLGPDAVAWLVRTDADGSVPMDVFFGLVRARFGLPEPVEELWAAYRARLPRLVTCRPEVLDGLARLRAAGWAVGIVTNGMADNQTGKIRRTGLAGRVDGWAISGAEGVRKPDARLFGIGAARCGASLTDGGWFVGDDPVKDVAGALAAGLRAIWVDRGRAPRPPGAEHVVTDVLDALELLMGMRPGGAV
ncbi:HAD family hydrolase [Actinomadura sp. ATCC 31491]|uniref:HAD family hydrolase n=1 Tax=Actinomadura luzonensis TaxID=2805427 RepID=A0ABT0FZM9_9ACTN|nr:HAD family hydrolase [Actinomadura luzonensis]MCK2217794.1 HAD family hydrolase [Actinomadura luzonensis]